MFNMNCIKYKTINSWQLYIRLYIKINLIHKKETLRLSGLKFLPNSVIN